MRITNNKYYLFFGEVDHYYKPFDEFILMLQSFLKNKYKLELDINDVKFTINDENPSSYHFVIPKWNTTISKLKEILNEIKEIDKSIYCEHWFRYPNQSKGTGQRGVHKIVHGNLIDFIIDFIPNESININDVQHVDESINEKHISKQPNPEVLKEIFDCCYKPIRSDDNHMWLSVGMALKNTYDDNVAIELFDYFSNRSNKYMGISSIEQTYNKLKKHENGYTVGTLFYYAIQDNEIKFLEIMQQQKC
jgi:hypothetical protein